VSIRTLRYYDKVGLLLPSLHTEAGYRLYSDEDLLSLQQILVLKFLGFSLEEIKVCLQTESKGLSEGDPGIEAGLKRWWQNFNELPTEEKPLQQPYGEEEAKFLQQAVAIYKYEQK